MPQHHLVPLVPKVLQRLQQPIHVVETVGENDDQAAATELVAGQVGSEKVTTLNLEVISADAERELLLVKGAIPGPRGGLVLIRGALKGGK